MTSYEFEKAAKNAVIKILKKKHGVEGITLEDLQFVWFAHLLGAKKATIYSPKMGKKYAEVTYNLHDEEIYVDIYEKISNSVITESAFKFDAGV